MDNRFTNTLNTNPVISLIDREKKAVPRSVFDFSNSKIINGLFGAIIPIDLIHTLPNEDYDIGYDILALSRTPLNRRVLSGCRLFVHSVYQPEGNLWEGAWNQKTGGRSGNIQLEKPFIQLTGDRTAGWVFDVRTPNSLADYLGVPICSYKPSFGLLNFGGLKENKNSSILFNVGDFEEKIDALPFFMYQRLCRDMFFNSNLLINNKALYPDNEYDFILPYSPVIAGNNPKYGINTRKPDGTFSRAPEDSLMPNTTNLNYNDFLSRISAFSTPSNSNTEGLCLTALRFRQFRGDYFTSALPFPDLIRGDAPVLDVQSISALSENDLISSVMGDFSVGNFSDVPLDKIAYGQIDGENTSSIGGISFLSPSGLESDNVSIKNRWNDFFKIKASDIASKLIGNNVSLADLRALMVYTLIKQKNALTGGDYNDLVKAHFGVSPKARNFQHTYIGGFYSDMVFNEVFQTSQDNTTPLGTTASRAVSAESGYIGKFHADDYGYIMTVLEIVPEVYYSQGINRNLTKLNREDVYLPETNELSPQPILNKEIFATTNEEYNNDVFGYTERNIEYKTRTNEVHGFAALGSLSEFDNSLLTKRRFNGPVTLNNDFVTMNPKNVDMSIFSYQQEPPFDLVIKSRIRKVSPIPYVSIPGGLDLSLS